MRRLVLALVSLAACTARSPAPAPAPAATPPVAAGPRWEEVVAAAGDARSAGACRDPGRDAGAPLQIFSEHQAALKRTPDDVNAAHAAHAAGRRLQHEAVALIEVALGDALVASAEARLVALGQPRPSDPPPPLLRALAVELLCDLAIVEQLRDDPEHRDDPAYVEREVEATRRLALAYFAEARAAGDDPDALDRLVAPTEARIQAAAATTPGAAYVLEHVPGRYAELARDRRAAARR